MEVIPAIDLKDGKVVRLRQGDAGAQTVYADDPIAVAEKFYRQGARRLHVVDLDGAFAGQMKHKEVIRELTQVGMDVEVGGGIRDFAVLEELFAQGVRWGIIGTQVAQNPQFVKEAAARFPGQIIVGLDLKEGELAISGWQETVPFELESKLNEFKAWGVAEIIYTEVSRDGMLEGPCFEGLEKMGGISPLPLVASGGVTTIADLKKLAQMEQAGLPIKGAIVGKALYSGGLALEDAIEAVSPDA